jgi:UDP-N-acetyl-2-amino-2-deoxyglucuronate dehydrogenase
VLKVMIIGAGAIAPAHIEGYLNFPERAEIRVIANPTVSRAQKLAEKYDIDVRTTDAFEEELSSVDVLSVCTPPSLHRDIAVRALEAGKHVLLEKPMALSLEECDAIIAAAERGGGKLSIVAQSRFITSIRKVLQIVQSGAYGKLLFAQINSFWWRGQNYYDLYWRGVWENEGGGCTLNHAVHHIDLLLWAKGLPKTVSTFMSNVQHDNSEEEDLSMSSLLYPDGTMAQINSSLIHHGEAQKLDFQMERAGLSLPFTVHANAARSNGFPSEDEETVRKIQDEYEELEALKYEHHTGQIDDFLHSIESDTTPLIDGREGRKTIELITAIYKSAITGGRVDLPLAQNDPHYTFAGRIKDAVRYNEKRRSVDTFGDSAITSFKGKF